MIEFKAIYEAYSEADGILSAKESKARSAASQAQWNKKRQLNDQAYFFMLFEQLENHINTLCLLLLGKKQAMVHWGARRAWDIIDTVDFETKFPFLKKVALLVERSSPVYADIKQYHKIRNNIAHGNVSAVGPINIPVEAKKIKNLANLLRG